VSVTEVNWDEKLSPKQQELLGAMFGRPRPVILFGGGSGCGKSHGLRASLVVSHQYIAETCGVRPRSVLIAENYGALQKRFESAWLEEYGPSGWMQPGVGTVRKSGEGGYGFYFTDPKYGYISMLTWDDPTALRGTEYFCVAYDESTTAPSHYMEQATVQLLRIGARQRGCPSNPLVLTSNWDGAGMGWHKAMFYDRNESYGVDPDDILFIPGVIDDNPNKEFVAQYKPTLEALTGLLRDSRLLGIPTMPTGAAFQMANPAVQGFDYYKTFPNGIPGDWARIMGVDWGYDAPFCALWTAISPCGRKAYTYRELYEAKVLDYDQAAKIVSATGGHEKIDRIYADNQMWQSRMDTRAGSRGPTIADTYNEVLGADDKHRFPTLQKAKKPERIIGANFLRAGLSRSPLAPWEWWVANDCRWLWSELTMAVHGYTNGVPTEDLDKKSPDHALTAAWYHLRTHLDRQASSPSESPVEMLNRAVQSSISVDARNFTERPRSRYDIGA
jgi:hypothetical protein